MLTESKILEKAIKKYTNKFGVFSGRHKARYIESGMPQHIICRALRGMNLLTPDEKGEVKAIIHGVLFRALKKYNTVKLYNFAFLSNHAHLLASAQNIQQMSGFMCYIQSQISKRLAKRFDWSGPLWDTSGYLMVALPTAEACEKCFSYILAQGTKEGLVGCPKDWTGAHGAEFWILGKKLKGIWVDGTRYSKRRWRCEQKKEKTTTDIKDFTEATAFTLERLPHWKNKSKDEIGATIALMNDRIIGEALVKRNGRPVLGMKSVYKSKRNKVRPLSKPPWHARKSVIVAWCSQKCDEVRDYLERYWNFQHLFFEAAKGDGEYPPGAWVSGGVIAVAVATK